MAIIKKRQHSMIKWERSNVDIERDKNDKIKKISIYNNNKKLIFNMELIDDDLVWCHIRENNKTHVLSIMSPLFSFPFFGMNKLNISFSEQKKYRK